LTAKPTTERIIVEDYQSSQENYLIYLIHTETYKFCRSYISGKKVLDYGCGSGYGTAMISENCSHVTGIDISDEAITHAKAHFKAENLSYLKVDPADDISLPFPDASFDVVLSFQVIEHVKNVAVYLKEIERVLVPGGYVIIATPDRSRRLFSFQKSWNMWHLREYSQSQLFSTLTQYFSNVNVKQMGGQRDVLNIELKRITKLKWIMLPFTLPFIPETVRINSIKLLKYIQHRMSRRSRKPVVPSFDETALSISDHENYSVNLVAVANKK
jgi:ubiquinone/menaquinone biosynthesis C-methylase UbiE